MTEHLEPKVRDNYHTVLMAKNMAGVLELNELISRSTDEEHFYYVNRISFDEFLNLSDNIITTSACLASPLNKLSFDHPRYMELAKKYDFLEVQAHDHPEQKAFNKRLSVLAKELGKPLIAGTDTHSSTPYKAECRHVLLAAKHKSYGDEDSFDLSLKTYDELVDMFKKQGALQEDEYMSAIENTNRLFDLVEDIDLDTEIKYPILYGTRDADEQEFLKRTERMFEEKVRNGIIPADQVDSFRSAIDEETAVFKKLKMTGFMLSMSELICWCKDHDIAIGPARGSVGGSRIAYVLDIIDLNPEKWHTIFSRFANENRLEIGDIDIDCIEDDRPRIFKYITGRFGLDKTSRVASFGTLQGKATIDLIGRYLAQEWAKKHPDAVVSGKSNPYSIAAIVKVKELFDADPEKAKEKHKDIFYYYDGLLDTKISQSVHPAGMVISPITMADNYGIFLKDGEWCMMLDMENIHDYTGLAKYDFLVLKTVQVIRDTCNYIGIPYPKTHEINWEDKEVWDDLASSPLGIFQFESGFAYDSLRKFKPQNIFEMAVVAACIRPTGASYRDELLKRVPHKNPSKMIDDLLSDSYGYLVFQEQTIAFLQKICGLSGGDADNIRRAIGRKQKERLDAALPQIFDGYCSKSDQPREIAEKEAREFLQVIEDSASYQFGYNHSVAYCLLGYLCGYYRHYYPIEFITSFLNNSANDEDIKNGTALASKLGIHVTMPKFGLSRKDYYFDKEQKIIAKGLASVKYMSPAVSDELYEIAQRYKPTDDAVESPKFTDILGEIDKTCVNSRQLDILIKIDFFSRFGNQRELLYITDIYSNLLKHGEAVQISAEKFDSLPFKNVVAPYVNNKTKAGALAKTYKITNMALFISAFEKWVMEQGVPDLSTVTKVKNFNEALGYAGYVSGKEEDRKKLYVQEVYPLKRKSDGKQFGYSVLTKSVGSGIESRFSVMNSVFTKDPIKKGDVIACLGYLRDGKYFQMTKFSHLQ